MSPDPTVAVYVCRHGATQLNQQGCFRGNKDVALAPEGIADARRLARLFQPVEISAIFTSDRKRASDTADIIAREHNIPIHKVEGLRALDVGDFSGKKRNKESEAELQAYLDKPNQEIPGGESLNDFKSRVRPCLAAAVDLFLECGVPPLIVAHSSIVHETGDWLYNNHKSILVEPGGAIAIYFRNGKLGAEPIFKPISAPAGDRSTVIS